MGFLWEAHLRRWPVRLVLCFTTDETLRLLVCYAAVCPEPTLSCYGVSPAGIWHCYWEYSSKSDSTSISDIGFTTNFNAYLQVKETWLAFCESDGDVSIHSNTCCIRVWVWGTCVMLCYFSVISDHHICGGGHSSPHPHLPAHQNPHSHRPHPGVQQVSRNVAQCSSDREADVRGHAHFVWNRMLV